MKVVIIEDEPIGARRLKRLLLQVSPNTEVVATLESVMEAKAWMENIKIGNIDLFFSDIQLADGLAFDIFEGTTVPVPIIFTTAYDEYALRAFRYNGIAICSSQFRKVSYDKHWRNSEGSAHSTQLIRWTICWNGWTSSDNRSHPIPHSSVTATTRSSL